MTICLKRLKGCWQPGEMGTDSETGSMRTCDHKGCMNAVYYYCGCERCDREPSSTEAFFACSEHQKEVDAYHRRVRGRRAKWYVGTEEDRAKYLLRPGVNDA